MAKIPWADPDNQFHAKQLLALLDYTDALVALVRDLRPRCRYVDRKEAETVKARIRALLPPEPQR